LQLRSPKNRITPAEKNSAEKMAEKRMKTNIEAETNLYKNNWLVMVGIISTNVREGSQKS
jgi:hypothetical protein